MADGDFTQTLTRLFKEHPEYFTGGLGALLGGGLGGAPLMLALGLTGLGLGKQLPLSSKTINRVVSESPKTKTFLEKLLDIPDVEERLAFLKKNIADAPEEAKEGLLYQLFLPTLQTEIPFHFNIDIIPETAKDPWLRKLKKELHATAMRNQLSSVLDEIEAMKARGKYWIVSKYNPHHYADIGRYSKETPPRVKATRNWKLPSKEYVKKLKKIGRKYYNKPLELIKELQKNKYWGVLQRMEEGINPKRLRLIDTYALSKTKGAMKYLYDLYQGKFSKDTLLDYYNKFRQNYEPTSFTDYVAKSFLSNLRESLPWIPIHAAGWGTGYGLQRAGKSLLKWLPKNKNLLYTGGRGLGWLSTGVGTPMKWSFSLGMTPAMWGIAAITSLPIQMFSSQQRAISHMPSFKKFKKMVLNAPNNP